MTSGSPQQTPSVLPRHRTGRRWRVASLVYGHAANDNRVIKTASSLQRMGADVEIIGAERRLEGHPAGAAALEGLPVMRVPDFDLVRMLPRVTRTWRRLRHRGRTDGAVQHTAANAVAPVPEPSSAQSSGSSSEPSDGAAGEPPAPPAAAFPMTVAGSAARLGIDVYMRTYQVVRLSYFWLGVVQRLRQQQPDLIHANDANTLVPAIIGKALTGADIVYDSHELWTERNIRQDRWLAPVVEAWIERWGVRQAGAVITVSPSIATWLQQRYGLARTPALVRNIPRRQADPSSSQASAQESASGQTTSSVPGLRDLAGLDADAQVIAYCGSITTGRGLEETIDALTSLDPRVHLVMLGYGAAEYRGRLLTQAQDAGVASRVHMVGTVPGPDVPATLADADASVVYVRPICLSYRYSLPNKLFESIHAGIPIAAADLPDIAALVRQYGVGEVFEAATGAGLADAIADVIARSEQFRRASRAAADELDWTHEERVLGDTYADVLNRRADR